MEVKRFRVSEKKTEIEDKLYKSVREGILSYKDYVFYARVMLQEAKIKLVENNVNLIEEEIGNPDEMKQIETRLGLVTEVR